MSLSLTPESRRVAIRPRGRWSYGLRPRALVLLGLGSLWLIPALRNPGLLPMCVAAMIAHDLFVAVAWLLDSRGLPPPRSISVERRWTSIVELFQPARVELSLSNASGVALRARLLDDPSPGMPPEAPTLETTVPAGAEGSVEYEVRPEERGDHQCGKVYLSYSTRFDLAERRAVADLEQRVRVYPGLGMARSRARFTARNLWNRFERRRARFKGRTGSFESLREYREGDPLKDVCWTATARRSKPVTKQYDLERNQAIWLVLDSGRLMLARARGPSKLDHMVDACLGLAMTAITEGDRVGLLTYARETKTVLPAAKGAAHLRQIVECLADLRAEPVEPDHSHVAARLSALQKHRGLVVWMTDMAETVVLPDVVEQTIHLGRRHLVLFVMVLQPEVVSMTAEIPDRVRGMFRSASALELVHQRELLVRQMQRQGVLVLQADPGNLTAALVSEYIAVKGRHLI